jgi:2-polyprenyl-3-methyl-5-hydroxy-6-metoxy-1,4-benzoquinol methylase
METAEYWERKFKAEKTTWGFKPSDSAILTKDFFVANQVKDILIPGIGYGRNARPFYDNGVQVTGIEISKQAIELARSENGMEGNIYHGSVTDMPFDEKVYDGIYCYALLHLLNNQERKRFIRCCYNQLKPNGYMVFVVISTQSEMFGKGRLLSKNRFEISNGLRVYFYDSESTEKEFKDCGLLEYKEIKEPIKHMENEPPLRSIFVLCQKKASCD